MGLVISALVTFWVGFLIYKKYKPQPVLFLGGMILMYIAAIFGYGTMVLSYRPKPLQALLSLMLLNLFALP